jgi:hypothetical protein
MRRRRRPRIPGRSSPDFDEATGVNLWAPRLLSICQVHTSKGIGRVLVDLEVAPYREMHSFQSILLSDRKWLSPP